MARAAMVNPAHLDRIGDVLPYSVVVTNAGTTPISALTVVFRYTFLNNPKPTQSTFFYHKFGQSEPLLAPGVSRLFTPFKTFSALAAGALDAALMRPDRKTRIREPLDNVRAAQKIETSVDLVVSTDGRRVGPDTSQVISVLSQRSQAHDAMKSELLGRLAKGQDVHGWLTSQVNLPIVVRPNSVNHHYVSVVSTLGGTWLKLLNERGPDALQKFVASEGTDPVLETLKTLKEGLQ